LPSAKAMGNRINKGVREVNSFHGIEENEEIVIPDGIGTFTSALKDMCAVFRVATAGA
jgi:hypothetical protein